MTPVGPIAHAQKMFNMAAFERSPLDVYITLVIIMCTQMHHNWGERREPSKNGDQRKNVCMWPAMREGTTRNFCRISVLYINQRGIYRRIQWWWSRAKRQLVARVIQKKRVRVGPLLYATFYIQSIFVNACHAPDVQCFRIRSVSCGLPCGSMLASISSSRFSLSSASIVPRSASS
jgi:hypothetical protein